MVLTAAEKQKRYRERMRANNPEKFEEAKRKNAARNKERKKISECTESEKATLRKQWKNRKNRQKNKLKVNVGENSSNDQTDNRARLAERKKIQRHLAIVKNNYETKISKMAKNILALKKKTYRLIKKQKSLMTRIEELEAKNTELLTIVPTNTVQDNIEMTPLTKTDSFIEENIPNISTPEKQKVKRQLLNYNVLTTALQNTYKNSKNNKDRNVLKRVVENDIVKKYKAKSVTTAVLGLRGRVRHRKTILRKNEMLIEEIKQFYIKDDVSRATAGKNEVKTLKKNKQQRRYLLKNLKDLYKKYRLEGGKAKYTAFKKYRPFYVLRPKLSNRETCGCIKHENMMLKIEKLKKIGLIESKNLDTIFSIVQCDLNSKECAYGECSDCEDNFISFNWGAHKKSETVTYEEFKLDNYEYINKKDNQIAITKKMEKKHINETLEKFVEKFNEELNIFKKHVYNIKHQYHQYSSCIKNLKNSEVAVHIDFSENYTCKLSTEVQSMHFGASKPQITIHTGVLYTSGNKPQAFASISPSNEHGPEAIWAHLEPILNHIRTEFPTVSAVHFFSDGPTSQYKQKKNFFLFSKYTKLLGFPHSTWNFSESSHGKGAADGVGGAIKRRLDGYVSQGTDIPNAQTAFKILKDSDTSVMTFYISEANIAKYTISETLTPVPQTMTLHQIANTETANVINFRCLSCFCCDVLFPKGHCECLDVKKHLLVQNKENDTENNPVRNKPNRAIKRKKKISELSETSDSEQEQKENRNKIETICRTGKNTKEKITILSDVKYRPENRAFCIKTFGNCQPKLKTINKSDPLHLSHKKNINLYDNPIPSTSFMSELSGKQNIVLQKLPNNNTQKNIFRKTHKMIDASSTEDDDDFSVHDTSDDELFIPDSDSEDKEESSLTKKIIESKTVQSDGNSALGKVKEKSGHHNKAQFEKTRMITNTDKDRELPDTEEERILSTNFFDIGCIADIEVSGYDYFLGHTEENCGEDEKDMELKKVKISRDGAYESVEEETGNYNNIQFEKTEMNKITDKDCELQNLKEVLCVGDSVLVRYFQRQSWKYYVGFIESYSVEVDETVRYAVRFLKTIYKPTLKFLPTKIDRDVVPELSVVKRIDVELNGKAYFLKNTSDQIFF